MMQTPLSIALTLWKIGIVSDRNLIAWADAQILAQDRPACDLLEVAAKGAVICLNQGLISTSLLSLSYSEEFSIRAYLLDLKCDRAAEAFIKWVDRNCFGSAEIPECLLGYQLQHLYSDRENVDAAIALLRDELPKLMPCCQAFAVSFLQQFPELELHTCSQ